MAYDLVTGQRTFCVAVSGLGGGGVTKTTDIPFVDSAGNLIKCGYFKVWALAGADATKGAVTVEVSGVEHTGNAILNSLSAVTTTANASGICGLSLPVGTYYSFDEWHGSNGQIATGVRLIVTANADADISVGITYGNLLALNSHRLAQSYDAGS
tara:strand:+ start:2032 stop:2496 length:465 start_codon:yes stop_codon:yes gene_type:complete